MTFDDFQKFIDEQHAFFETFRTDSDNAKEIFGRTIKLGEEYGELCDEILAFDGRQRSSKLGNPSELEGEFADVVIVAFLLAKSMNVDMQKALAEKTEKIKSKHNKEMR